MSECAATFVVLPFIAHTVIAVVFMVVAYRIGYSDGRWSEKHDENMRGLERLRKRLRNRGACND